MMKIYLQVVKPFPESRKIFRLFHFLFEEKKKPHVTLIVISIWLNGGKDNGLDVV